MENEVQHQILGAILLVLRPFAKALLRVGVGYREFSEIAKIAFVDTATNEYGLRGRPTNVSRVAVMTGLTRKEVKRLRDKSEASEHTVVMKTTPVSQILHRWFTDAEFLNEKGSPSALPYDGDGVTFSSLVKKHGGDVPAGAMRTELRRIDGIRETTDGLLIPTKRIVYNIDLHDRLIGGLAGILHPAALNLAHNLDVDDDSSRWANMAATSRFVRVSDRGRIMKISSDRMNEFVESIDDTYAAYEALNKNEVRPLDDRAIGVAVFYFEEDKSQSDVF